MDTRFVDGYKEKTKRPIRTKKHSRKSFFIEKKRPPKRLFTPEIKRFLKDWLVRRRENPYPNRDEKKMLAVQTGLTYIQVCNWFANWRRKLKNAGKEPHQRTWSDLIKTYNNQVQGNVEHFSICSDDSIWEGADDVSNYTNDIYDNTTKIINNNNQNQCYFISSTTPSDQENPFSQNKYKNHLMEKYIRDCQKPFDVSEENKPSMISKWLESAANFKPDKNTYVDWTFKSTKRRMIKSENSALVRGREELDAAEALATLANFTFKI